MLWIFSDGLKWSGVVEEAIRIHDSYQRPYVVWMQLGIVNQAAVVHSGLDVFMDRCMKIEHARLGKH